MSVPHCPHQWSPYELCPDNRTRKFCRLCGLVRTGAEDVIAGVTAIIEPAQPEGNQL